MRSPRKTPEQVTRTHRTAFRLGPLSAFRSIGSGPLPATGNWRAAKDGIAARWVDTKILVQGLEAKSLPGSVRGRGRRDE